MNNNTSTMPEKPFATVWRKLYSLLTSFKLTIALLIVILLSCLIGVTIVHGEHAGALIFGAVWFNALLILLVVNSAFCFFPRIWRRKLTLVSFGMILFHLSFVTMLCGVVYNSLFYFRGVIRLTEGEALQNGDPQSYDMFDHGRFFSFLELKGETRLIKMHKGYKVDGKDKVVAYEVSVGENLAETKGIIYITNSLEHDGFGYYSDKEGYSVLTVLYDRYGRELFGAFVPLQSFKQKDKTYLYTTGTKDGPGPFPFPQGSADPLFFLQLAYSPPPETAWEGKVGLQVWPFSKAEEALSAKPLAKGSGKTGKKIKTGDYYFSVPEVRYWVIMNVSHEPGKPVVLTSLWTGLAGIVLTFIGRLRRGGN